MARKQFVFKGGVYNDKMRITTKGISLLHKKKTVELDNNNCAMHNIECTVRNGDIMYLENVLIVSVWICCVGIS